MAKEAYHHGDLPRSVMAAALEELTEGDRFALNFNRIARRLGVSHAAIYRHFPSKQALVDALAHSGFEQLGEELGDTLAQLADASTQERISALAARHVGFVLENPALARLMFSGAAADRQRAPELKQAAFQTIMMLQGEVARGAEEGWIEGDELYDVTRTFWAGMHGLAMLRIEGQFDAMLPTAEEFDRLVQRSATWMIRGVTRPLSGEGT